MLDGLCVFLLNFVLQHADYSSNKKEDIAFLQKHFFLKIPVQEIFKFLLGIFPPKFDKRRQMPFLLILAKLQKRRNFCGETLF